MTDKPENPPAFPHDGYNVSKAGGAYKEKFGPGPGMTLRDYFAGQALVGMETWAPVDEVTDFGVPDRPVWELKAEWAYKMADAMLAERSKS